MKRYPLKRKTSSKNWYEWIEDPCFKKLFASYPSWRRTDESLALLIDVCELDPLSYEFNIMVNELFMKIDGFGSYQSLTIGRLQVWYSKLSIDYAPALTL